VFNTDDEWETEDDEDWMAMTQDEVMDRLKPRRNKKCGLGLFRNKIYRAEVYEAAMHLDELEEVLDLEAKEQMEYNKQGCFHTRYC